MSDNWTQYFECEIQDITDDDIVVKKYMYKDKTVTALPRDLPMPPTDIFVDMFAWCCQLRDISALAHWDVSNVKDMCIMFNGCEQLQDITPLANWDVSNVRDMSGMFANCHQLQDITPLANWDVSNVRDMSGMFIACHQLRDISALAHWDVSNVKTVQRMFQDCKQLKDISDLANWDISSNVILGRTMFSNRVLTRTIVFLQEAKQRISELQKENAELKARLAYLEEKVGD